MIDVPKELISVHDSVWFTGIYDGKRKTFKGHSCYSAYTHNTKNVLPKTTLECTPNQTSTPSQKLSADIYQKWMDLCKEHYLVPKEAECFSKEDGNYFTLNGKGLNRHQIYAALCCFRWADSTPRMAYITVKALEENPRLHFFQLIHYVSAKYVVNVNHSFLQIGNTSNYFTIGRFLVDQLNLIYPLCTYLYFKNNVYIDTKFCYDAIEQYMKRLKIPVEYIGKNKETNLLVKDREDILREEWAELYRMEFNLEKIKSYYDGVAK